MTLVVSPSIVRSHARRSQQLVVFFANKYEISLRLDSNSPTNSSSIRRLPLDYWSDRHQELEDDDYNVLLQKKITARHPRPHAVVTLRFVVDNTHRTALSSMLKGLGDSNIIEGDEKKPTGPSLGLTAEYVSLEKRAYLRKLGVVGDTCLHPASPLSPWIGHRYRCRGSLVI